MTRRIGVQEPGDSGFLPGERVDSKNFRDTNRRMVEEGNRPAEGRPELMGITKASLATDSWLSAASFQETTRVLTEAAIDGRGDSLVIGHVAGQGDGLPAGLSNLGGDLVDLAAAARQQRDRGAFLREMTGGGRADAAACAGDDDGFAFQMAHMRAFPRCLWFCLPVLRGQDSCKK